MPKFAIFVDLENCGAKSATLNYIIERVKIRGDILLGRVYGYTDRYADLKELLLSNTFNVVPSLRFGHHQKNNLDIQLVIDALEVAYTNQLIDSFCIVSGDSDYTPLVGKLKTMGKFVLGISRSEVASGIFINACSEFLFLETVAATKKPAEPAQNGNGSAEPFEGTDMARLIETILEEAEEDEMHASILKNTILRLRPDFSEKAYGCSSFGKLLARIEKQYGTIQVTSDNFNVTVSLKRPEQTGHPVVSKDNYIDIMRQILKRFKDDGFARINPSILKATVQNDFPDFNERALGFKRFSDLMKRLEKEKLVAVELDEQRTMLINIL